MRRWTLILLLAGLSGVCLLGCGSSAKQQTTTPQAVTPSVPVAPAPGHEDGGGSKGTSSGGIPTKPCQGDVCTQVDALPGWSKTKPKATLPPMISYARPLGPGCRLFFSTAMPILNPPPADKLAQKLTPLGTTPKEQKDVPPFRLRLPGIYMQKLIVYKNPTEPLAQNGAIYAKIKGKTYLVLNTIDIEAVPGSGGTCDAEDTASARKELGEALLQYMQNTTL